MDTSSLLDFKNRRFRVVLRLTLVVAVLFYMMYNLINGNIVKFYVYFSNLGLASLGIAVGIILASVFVQVVIKTIKQIKTKKC